MMKVAFVFLALAMMIVGINADAWAQFCNDDNCSVGCGEWVAVGNPGCLGESGRKSVNFKGDSPWHYALLYTPVGNSQCGCQFACDPDVWPNPGSLGSFQCHKLNADASSFRFIGDNGYCPSDTC
ncbi:uncharacterized protein BX664DRAFT_331736 [Halteromyces radiatus]|uniref:uncharacterized protein n=1 Tax=Halteromyces radiatus TaxID=101107 RepID=UPI002220607B|nr:uncharacterized protein BX664DRAFT_331736 [Halteromyces radiatus]KAI8088922.1 hypothetical protein BX664DRAFT_331736 [Halteromyces radiatus]